MAQQKWYIRLSIWANERTGGHNGWPLCAEYYNAYLIDQSAVNRWRCILLDAVFYRDPQHCRKSWLLRNKGE